MMELMEVDGRVPLPSSQCALSKMYLSFLSHYFYYSILHFLLIVFQNRHLTKPYNNTQPSKLSYNKPFLQLS